MMANFTGDDSSEIIETHYIVSGLGMWVLLWDGTESPSYRHNYTRPFVMFPYHLVTVTERLIHQLHVALQPSRADGRVLAWYCRFESMMRSDLAGSSLFAPSSHARSDVTVLNRASSA